MSLIDATGPDAVLSQAEGDSLAELEQVIGFGLDHFVAVGRALTEITQRRLDLLSHRTFKARLGAASAGAASSSIRARTLRKRARPSVMQRFTLL